MTRGTKTKMDVVSSLEQRDLFPEKQPSRAHAPLSYSVYSGAHCHQNTHDTACPQWLTGYVGREREVPAESSSWWHTETSWPFHPPCFIGVFTFLDFTIQDAHSTPTGESKRNGQMRAVRIWEKTYLQFLKLCNPKNTYSFSLILYNSQIWTKYKCN